MLAAANTAVAAEPLTTAADWWRRQLPADCRAVVAAGVIAAGDLADTELDELARRARQFVDALRAEYGLKPAAADGRPLAILAFGASERFVAEAARLFAERPRSRSGCYCRRLHAVAIAADALPDALHHELTHAALAAAGVEFSEWWAEGLATLHEPCRVEAGRLAGRGLARWRAALLKPEAAATFADEAAESGSTAAARAAVACLLLERKRLLPALVRGGQVWLEGEGRPLLESLTDEYRRLLFELATPEDAGSL